MLTMTRLPVSRVRVAMLILSFVTLALAAAPLPAQPAQPYIYAGETPAAALSRHLRVLSLSPGNFHALIGAGKAALSVGDIPAAIGFFGRADEINPASPLPQAGIAAATVAEGQGREALAHFARAQQLGANGAMLGADRGLAYDLLGRHSEAQADYRQAMYGPDPDEARRRLALSLAITGDKAGALSQLSPLISRRDPGAARVRALVLALTGDYEGARRSIDLAMPGSAVRMAPFLAQLPQLRSEQKAAAVNLGIFPDSGRPNVASAGPSQFDYDRPKANYSITGGGAPVAPPPVRGPTQTPADRLASIDQLLGRAPAPGNTRAVAAPRQPVTAAPPLARPVQIAGMTPSQAQQIGRQQIVNPGAPAASTASNRQRVWLQLASGPNAVALTDQFRRLKSRNGDLLDGISGYVAEEPSRARLLIGPFKSVSDADTFAEDLESVRVDAFSWTSAAGQPVRKLPTE
jgi:tetratricopeptide (TPR) repeat protein